MVVRSSIGRCAIPLALLGLCTMLGVPPSARAVSPSEVKLCHIPDNIFCSPNPPRDTRRTCNYETIFVAPRAVQRHLDHGDFLGDCDPDNDGIRSNRDNCPNHPNPNQANADGDAAGDACDKCPLLASANQSDTDNDGVGDVCDNCPTRSNANQANGDGDTIGTACDNCPTVSNTNQADGDADGIGTVCDNCPTTANANQANSDGDSRGNVCDGCAADPNKIAPGACGCGVPDVDADGDGALACAGDCNDNDPNVFPPQPSGPPRFDDPCDGVDIDCSHGGGCEPRTAECCTAADCGPMPDGCGGGFGCGGPDSDSDGFAACAGDCNDSDPDIHPNLPGVARFDAPCDGKDIDCTDALAGCERRIPLCCTGSECGQVSDGCGGTMACPGFDNDSDGVAGCAGDCDDGDPNIHPNLPGVSRFDIPCDGQDIDCSEGLDGCERRTPFCCGPSECGQVSDGCGGTIACGVDNDLDTVSACSDCNDNDPTIFPNGPGLPIRIDQACDGKDIDCSDGLGGCERLCQPSECLLQDGTNKCGDTSDGCGGTFHCGDCNAVERCVGSECCFPGLLPLCDRNINPGSSIVGSCGVHSDACGGLLDCGPCRSGLVCTATGICAPGPQPPACTPNCVGKKCGQSDGCGNKCTGCPADQICSAVGCVKRCGDVVCGVCTRGTIPVFGGEFLDFKQCPSTQECVISGQATTCATTTTLGDCDSNDDCPGQERCVGSFCRCCPDPLQNNDCELCDHATEVCAPSNALLDFTPECRSIF